MPPHARAWEGVRGKGEEKRVGKGERKKRGKCEGERAGNAREDGLEA